MPVLRAVKITCRNDIDAQRQIVAAIRTSIAELMNAGVAEMEIVRELDLTRQLLRQNIAQAQYNAVTGAYAVKITEEMVPTSGVTVDIKTPGELLDEQKISLDDIVAKHSA